MNDCRNCQKIQVGVRPSVTLSDNYNRLQNKPSINGVELSGAKTAAELNLLTRCAEDYRKLCLGATDGGSFLLALTAGEPRRVSLAEVIKPKLITVKQPPSDWEVGTYIFLLKGE